MWTKQHLTYCVTCGRNTNQVTHYRKDDAGGSLTAEVQCAEHTEAVVHGDVSSAHAAYDSAHAAYDSARGAVRPSDHMGMQSL
ncbi:hypothetical protein [Arthrobacter sp. 754]|uniref:hypothetical protein n=1 Tax=Arthrobacter sp. 754 TaxID=3156315 RepID=UPI003395812A